MANEEIKNPITSIDEAWHAKHTGHEVEAFLKQTIKGMQQKIELLSQQKVGEVMLSPGADGEVTVRFFADADARERWEQNPTEQAQLLLGSMSFRVSEAGGDEYTLATRVTKLPDSPSVKGSANTLRFSYSSYYGGDPTNLDTETGTATVSINGTEIDALRLTLRPGNDYEIDLGPYLTSENNTVTLTVANAHGKRRVFNLTVQVVEISIAFDDSFDETLLREAGWPLRVKCNGVEATLHLLIDGNEHLTASVRNSTIDFPVDASGALAAGAHEIEVYADNTEFNLRSETIRTRFIKKGLSVPTVCIGRNADSRAKLYANANIPYFISFPSAVVADTVSVSARILRLDGGVLKSGITQSVSFPKNGESGLQYLRLALTDPAYLTAGRITVEITCGGAKATHEIEVLDPGVNLQPAAECKVHLAAAGRSNTDSDAEEWTSTYNGEVTCRVKRSDNFRLTTGTGFTGDAFFIPTGRRITLGDVFPFVRDCGANATNAADRTGKTIEFEFATRNCTNASAKVIECLDGGIGFVIHSDGMELRTASGSVRTIWSDETRLRVGVVIEGTTRHCVNKTVGGTTELDANLAYIYVNGVPVRIMSYERASWKQPSPKEIVIGSDECDVELYSVRIYDKALTTTQMIGNYAFDTPDPDEKVAIAKRNDVLDSYGEVSFAKVREALPMTPYKIWEIPKMPTGKEDWQKVSTEFVNPAWTGTADDLIRCSYTEKDHDMALDGTSSLSYPDPYKNWANKHNGEITVKLKDGTQITVKTISIAEGVPNGGTEDVDKVNFASSEGIFNILAANAYQSIMRGVAASYPSILTPMQAAQQAADGSYNFRQSLAGFPEIGYLRTYENGVPKVRFLSIYNYVNNKYDGTPYGATRENGTEMWEVEDNVNFYMEHCPEGEWKNGKWNDRITTLYYARYPKKDTAGNDYGKASAPEGVDAANEQSRRMRNFHNFIQSCNPSVAERYRLKHGSYAKLPEPVTYGSRTFTEDTPEYRIARFRAEGPKWLDKPNALFYFNFFTGGLGIDSMDKNSTDTLTKETNG